MPPPLYVRIVSPLLTPCLVLVAAASFAQVPAQGCPQSHCDGENSDFVNIDIYTGSDAEIVDDSTGTGGELSGSGIGLGCSSDGTLVACSYRRGIDRPGDADNVIVYDYDLSIQWRSEDELGPAVAASAPLFFVDQILSIDTTFVIISDEDELVRIEPDPLLNGDFDWRVDQVAGTVISPVITANEVVVLAGTGEQIASHRQSNGNELATLTIEDDDTDPDEYYTTQNTPAVDGNRVYLSMQQVNDTVSGRVLTGEALLVAVDVDPAGTPVLQREWSCSFKTDPPIGSRSSPLIMEVSGSTVLLFDGYKTVSGTEQPHIFAVRDDGSNCTPLWDFNLVTSTPGTPTFASFAADPDGDHFWHLQVGSPQITKRRTSDGVEVDAIDVAALIDTDPATFHITTSAMSISDATNPVMVVAARPGNTTTTGSWLLAIDLDTGTADWTVEMPSGFFPAGQFPVVTDTLDPRVVFSGSGPGVYAVGQPSP